MSWKLHVNIVFKVQLEFSFENFISLMTAVLMWPITLPVSPVPEVSLKIWFCLLRSVLRPINRRSIALSKMDFWQGRVLMIRIRHKSKQGWSTNCIRFMSLFKRLFETILPKKQKSRWRYYKIISFKSWWYEKEEEKI